MTNDDYEKTFRSMNDELASFFNASPTDISEDELRYAFPIQYDLLETGAQYSEHEVIGEGGIKKIIRVTDAKTDRSVAKAVLLKDCGREGVEAFLREARLTSSLQHPNIIPIYDMGLEEDGSPYFIMEHLTGDTLGTVIKKLAAGDSDYKAQYSRSALLDIFANICNAVAYAHSRNIIHLDLKPENIHINSYGQVHVCDWGLGKFVSDDSDAELAAEEDLSQLDPEEINTKTLNGEIKGSPGFMAPEQAMFGREKNKQTDIYALGALLYNMLSFQLAVEGKTAEEIIRHTREGRIRTLEDSVNIPESLAAIVHKALQKEPQDRYDSVIRLSQDIDRYRHGFPTSAENAGFGMQLKMLIKRNRLTSSLLASFILLSMIGGIAAFKRIDNQRRLALAAKEDAQQQQRKAEKTLSLYLQERQVTERQGRNIDVLLSEIASSQDLTKPKKQIAILEQALERDMSAAQKKSFYTKLVILNFVLQNFDEAQKYLIHVRGEGSLIRLASAIKEFASLKAGRELLTDSDFADLIIYLSHTQRYIIPFMYHQHMMRSKNAIRKPLEYWPLAKAMLMMVNNYWNTEPLERPLVAVNGGYSLDLSRTRYRTFRCHAETFSISILAPLKLKTLDLSYTPFFEFWQLTGLGLESINFTGCWIREIHLGNLDALQKMGLKEITLDSSFYKLESIKLLRESFTVKDVKSSFGKE